MRWMVIFCAAVPLAYGAEPSEVEHPETTAPVASETPEKAPDPDPDVVSQEEARHFQSLGYRQRKEQGKMVWCRREGEVLPGSRLTPRVCRTAQEVRDLGEAPRETKPRKE
jgi:hypothetical protein